MRCVRVARQRAQNGSRLSVSSTINLHMPRAIKTRSCPRVSRQVRRITSSLLLRLGDRVVSNSEVRRRRMVS